MTNRYSQWRWGGLSGNWSVSPAPKISSLKSHHSVKAPHIDLRSIHPIFNPSNFCPGFYHHRRTPSYINKHYFNTVRRIWRSGWGGNRNTMRYQTPNREKQIRSIPPQLSCTLRHYLSPSANGNAPHSSFALDLPHPVSDHRLFTLWNWWIWNYCGDT